MPTTSTVCHVVEVKIGSWYYTIAGNAVGPFDTQQAAHQYLERSGCACHETVVINNHAFKWTDYWSHVLSKATWPVPD